MSVRDNLEEKTRASCQTIHTSERPEEQQCASRIIQDQEDNIED